MTYLISELSNQWGGDLQQLKVKDVMTKNPISVDADVLAAKSLSLMNENRITFLL